MYQLYTLEHAAAEQRTQRLQQAHAARLLRQAHAPQRSLVARMHAWWRTQFMTTLTGRSAEQPATR